MNNNNNNNNTDDDVETKQQRHMFNVCVNCQVYTVQVYRDQRLLRALCSFMQTRRNDFTIQTQN